MPRLNIPATKINLLRIKGELKLAQEGYDLLEQKRQVLVMEVMRLMGELEGRRKAVEETMRAACAAIDEAEIDAGAATVARAALAAGAGMEVTIRERSVMGVVVPVVDAAATELRPSYGMAETTAAIDEAARAFHAALAEVAVLSGIENSALRLATELRKTQRRVNALSSFFIPQYAETKKYLQDTLEERERDSLFAVKLLKAKAKG